MKRHKKLLYIIICDVLCVTLFLIFVYNFAADTTSDEKYSEIQVVTVWQIDSFEGGKGSRAEYIRKKGEEYAEGNNVYFDVVSLTAEAVRKNLKNGTLPDIISYGSGIYGVESYINGYYQSKVWCRGGYCILSLETEDFSLVSNENTVINCGKDNLISVAALFCGLNNADFAMPASAYIKLINGDYKFLLGTQRDIVRLQTRGVNFYVCPITYFNDLYQNISIVSSSTLKAGICADFINYIIDASDGISSLSLFCDGLSLYSDSLSVMEGLDFEYTVPAVISADYFNEINKIVKQADIDKLKSLLKSL